MTDLGKQDVEPLIVKDSSGLTVELPAPGTWYIGVECVTTVETQQTEWGEEYTGNLGVLNGVAYQIRMDVNRDSEPSTPASSTPASPTPQAPAGNAETPTQESPPLSEEAPADLNGTNCAHIPPGGALWLLVGLVAWRSRLRSHRGRLP